MNFSEMLQRAESGDTEAMRAVAMAYLQGENAEDNFGKALEWIDRAAELGNVEAMAEMADVYRKVRKLDQAFEWEEKAANQGRAQSMYNLSVHYRDGLGVPKNKEMHRYWYDKAKKNGFPPR